MNIKKIIILSIGIMVCIALFFGYNLIYRFPNDPIYIALTGPMSGENAPEGESYLQGFQLYIDQVND
jgi:ABC-type branched-subunit amino acid transport system substrate-binding protein